MLLNKFIPHLITIVVNVMLCIYPSIITTSSSIHLTYSFSHSSMYWILHTKKQIIATNNCSGHYTQIAHVLR